MFEEVKNLKTDYKGVFKDKNDIDQTIVHFNKLIEENPHDHNAYYNRGIAWYNKRDLKRALSDAKNSLTLDKKNRKYQHFVAYLEAEISNREEKAGK